MSDAMLPVSPVSTASEFRQAIGEHLGSHNFDEPLLRSHNKEVWGSTTNDLVVKVRRITAGKRAGHEYEEQLRLCDLLDAHDSAGFLRKRAMIPRPLSFVICERRQMHLLVMKRLYHARPGRFAALQRMYLGCRNYNHDIPYPASFARDTPNNYLSYGEVDDIVNACPTLHPGRTNLEQICHDLGTLLALVHFGAKRDGRNLEVVIARRERAAAGYTLALLDFDKIEKLEAAFARRDEGAIVGAIISSMANEYYCPFPTSRGFRHFRQGYLACAEELARQDGSDLYPSLAVRLIRLHVARWLRRTMLRFFAVETGRRLTADRRRAYRRFVQEERNVNALHSFIEEHSYCVSEEEIFGFVQDRGSSVRTATPLGSINES